MKRLNESGQTLVIVVFVMVIALAAGVVASERLITGYRRSISIDSSSRAMAVAEASLERILALPTSTLSGYISNNNCGSVCQLTITGSDGVVASAQVTLAYSGNSVETLDVDIEKDSTYQIELSGYPSTAPIELCWDDALSGDNPSLYASYVNGSSSYTISKYAYNSSSSLYTSNGFSQSSADLSYPNCFTIGAKTSPKFIRVRAIYNDLKLHVIPKDGAVLPIQGYLITSTGSVNNVIKKVVAIKSQPSLPSSFDFALFSTSDSSVLQN